ncbi:MAG TPA: hypothetical protein VF950_17150 [Planctomycetota bacterium]
MITLLLLLQTRVEIVGEKFHVNGKPTYQGTTVEGLLMNSRVVQATFDDLNPETAKRWAYKDTGAWDPERNVKDFIAALPEWRAHGLLGITLNFQGGSPEGYSKTQPWENNAFEPDGALRPAYVDRLRRVLDKTDELGMVAIVGIFYFGQDERLKDEAAVIRAFDGALDVLKGRRNVLIEANNECDVRYDHDILKPARIHELIARAKSKGFLAGTSYGGGTIPKPNVVKVSDFLLLHGNGVSNPDRIGEMVRKAREVEGYRPMPILFNEDDHFDFDQPKNNMAAAVAERAGWGYFDPQGYQSPPVRWGLDTDRKKAFFSSLKKVTER